MSDARIALFTMGGTIAMASTGSAESGVIPKLTGADLLAGVPGLAGEPVQIDVHDFLRKPAGWYVFGAYVELAAAIRAELSGGATGVVVTQGTDTLEETAYLLGLLHDSDVPLVVSGAMRHPALAGADGPANLLAAIRVAGDPQSRGRGALVVLNDEIHSATWVRKSHTTSPAAFTSPATGPVGLLVEGVACYAGPPPARQVIGPVPADSPVKVGLAVASFSDTGEWLVPYAEGLDGLVVAGFGVGHVPAAWVDPLDDLTERIPVVLASRIGVGPVLKGTYGFAGSETDLLGRGLLGAGQLDPFKARILLWTLLASGASRDEIMRAFRQE